MSPRTRRRFLRVAAGVLAMGAAGCTGEPTDGDRGSGQAGSGAPRATPTPTGTATATETEPTAVGTGGPDERVDRRPPASPALSPAGTWPSYRFDAGNTGSRVDGEGLRDGEGYWRVAAGGTASTNGETVVNVFGRDREKRALARRDPATVGVESLTPLVEYGVNSPPTLADGRAFVTTFVEVICCATGRDEVLWRGPEMDGIHGSPTVRDDTVLVASGGYKDVGPQLRAFAAEDGTERWRYDVGSVTKSTPAVADGAVFVVGSGGVDAVELDTGDRRFHAPEAAERWATPVAAGGTVYAADASGELVALSTDEGTVRWRREVKTDRPPVVADGEVYTDTGDGIAALAVEDGSVRRTFEGGGTPVARVGDVVYAVSEGVLRAFDVGGEQLWRYGTEQVRIQDTVGRAIAGVTPVDGAVYVSARDAFHGIGPAE